MKRIILLAAFVFGLAFNVSAQPAKKQMRMMKPGFDKPMREVLNLSDEQKAKIADIKIETAKQMVDLKAQLQKNRLAVKQLLNSDKPDQEKIMDIVNSNSEITAKMKSLKVENWFKVYNLLDPSQQKIFKNSFGKWDKGQFMKGKKRGMRKGFRRPPMGERPPFFQDKNDED